MDKDKAQLAQAIYETWIMVKESAFGEKLLTEMQRIKTQATNAAMYGKTPETVNQYMESRGKALAVKQIERVFQDIETDNKSATDWLSQNVEESAPANTSSTTPVEEAPAETAEETEDSASTEQE